jgi:hypothetical protein
MAHIIEDRVMETSTTTGTGNFSLAGAVAGFRDFDSVMANGDTCYYLIEAVDSNGVPTGDWETGIGTFNDTDTLVRTTVSRSTNSNNAVNFAAGTKRVSLTRIARGLRSLELITETITSGSATNVQFASIPGIYRDLELRIRGRGTTAANFVAVRMRFNGDTAANYDHNDHQLGNTATSGFAFVAQTSITIGNLAAASATPAYADFLLSTIADYQGTTFQKAGHWKGSIRHSTTTASMFNEQGSFWWRSTSAITQIDVFPSAGGFVDNSVVSLYGYM